MDDITPESVANLRSGTTPTFEAMKWLLSTPAPPELVALCKNSAIRCFSRIRAPRGYYTIPEKKAIGNSHVCFKDGVDWTSGQIQHIFDYGDGKIFMAIHRSQALRLNGAVDPFKSFWEHGFQARLVSSSFSRKLEIFRQKEVLGHVARWELVEGKTVVLSLARVSS